MTSRAATAENIAAAYDDSYTVTELKEIAKEKGIPGYYAMNKTELLEAVNDVQ